MRKKSKVDAGDEVRALHSEAVLSEGEYGDGGLAVSFTLPARDGEVHVQRFTPEVVAGVRFMVARLAREKGQIPTRLAFTSALSGEGVTFMSRAFGAVMGHDFSRRVCVVDFHTDGDTFDDSATLAQAAAGTGSVADAVVATSIPRLAIARVGGGSTSERAVLAQSIELENAVDELAQMFDHIVLDLPPLLAESDALVLSRFAEAYVLVTRHGVTTEQQIEAAIDELSHLTLIGVAVNGTDTRVPRWLRRIVGGPISSASR